MCYEVHHQTPPVQKQGVLGQLDGYAEQQEDQHCDENMTLFGEQCRKQEAVGIEQRCIHHVAAQDLPVFRLQHFPVGMEGKSTGIPSGCRRACSKVLPQERQRPRSTAPEGIIAGVLFAEHQEKKHSAQ